MNAMKKISSVLLCILASVLFLWAIVGFSVKGLLSKDALTQMMSQTANTNMKDSQKIEEITDALENGKLDSEALGEISEKMTSTLEEYITGDGDTDSLSDAVYEALSDERVTQHLGDRSISRTQVETLIDDSTITEFAAEYASDFAESITKGEQPAPITANDLKKLVSDNKAVIEKTFDVTIDDEVMNAVEKAIDDKSETIQAMTTIDIESEDNSSIQTVMNFSKIFLSDTNLIIALCGGVILVLLTAAINKKISAPLIYGGATLLITAIVIAVFSAIGGTFSSMVPQRGLVSNIANQFFTTGISTLISRAVLLCIIGVSMIAVYIIIRIIKKSRSKESN